MKPSNFSFTSGNLSLAYKSDLYLWEFRRGYVSYDSVVTKKDSLEALLLFCHTCIAHSLPVPIAAAELLVVALEAGIEQAYSAASIKPTLH